MQPAVVGAVSLSCRTARCTIRRRLVGTLKFHPWLKAEVSCFPARFDSPVHAWRCRNTAFMTESLSPRLQASTASTRRLLVCAENVAISHILHPVSAPPSRSTVDERSVRRDGYALPFEHERKLVSVLAFLSSLTDKIDHVPAVCVEETRGAEGLRVLLAVNKKSHLDGDKTLALIEDGFRSLFAVMGRISNVAESEDSEDAVFTAIVSICSARILCRLGLKPSARKPSKQTFKTILEKATVAVRQLRATGKKGDGTNPAAGRFENSAKNVIKLLNSWASYQSDGRLKEVILGVHELARAEGFQSLLDRVPHRDMDPTSKDRLMDIVHKVSRYRDAARFLYRSAKKLPITRRMAVMPVQLPEEAFRRAPRADYKPSLASSMARLGLPQSRAKLGSMCRLLNMTEQEATGRFEKQTLETLKKGKIHAEVQLLAHCELTSCAKLPRVICSSKDACFLCNALISLFKDVHIPRCHGKLYPGWLLPAIPSLARMQGEFNDYLGGQIVDSLATLLKTQRKTMHPCPKESTLLTLSSSATTIANLSIEGGPGGSIDLPIVTGEDAPESGSSPSTAPGPFQTSTKDAAGELPADDVHAASNTPHGTLLYPADARSGVELMAQGRTRSMAIDAGATSRVLRAGQLEVHVENSRASSARAGGESTSDSSNGRAICSLEWLTDEEAQRLREEKPHLFIDMESLSAGDELRLQNASCFYMAAKNSHVRLCFGQN